MKQNRITRRNFVKTAGLLGASAIVGGAGGLARSADTNAPEPTGPARVKVGSRPFGKTGVRVAMLSLGGLFDIPSNQLVLKQALDWGVTYWDTAESYTGGRSETGIGMFFEKHPQARKEVFLVTKTTKRNPQAMTDALNQSLERMKTDYIDLFFMHGISGTDVLDNEVKAWAERAKKHGKIRFFGFSTHQNMEKCLQGAAKLGWIDGVMLTYNYRIMNTDAMKSAIDAATKAGIGLTAMKTQAKRIAGDDAAEAKLLEHFLQRGFTAEQAKLKVVWENQQIASICSAMYTISTLSANVAAAIDKTALTAADRAALARAAADSCDGYCAGCTCLCENAIGHRAPIGDVMRCLMYYHGYGDRELARELFGRLPESVRTHLASADFSDAERVCPHHLPITRLMRQAEELLA